MARAALRTFAMTTNRQQHLFRFGIVADVQYADKEDNNGEGRTQRYREAPGKLKEVVARWKGMDGSMRCVLQMGDIVDGNADGGALKTSKRALRPTLGEAAPLQLSVTEASSVRGAVEKADLPLTAPR